MVVVAGGWCIPLDHTPGRNVEDRPSPYPGVVPHGSGGPAPWKGQCFVFDRRVAVKHGLAQGDYSMCFACGEPMDARRPSSLLILNSQFQSSPKFNPDLIFNPFFNRAMLDRGHETHTYPPQVWNSRCSLFMSKFQGLQGDIWGRLPFENHIFSSFFPMDVKSYCFLPSLKKNAHHV